MAKTLPQVMTIVVLSVVSCLLSSSICLAQVNKEVVRIGAIIPLTGGQAYGGDDIAKLLSIMEDRLNRRSQKYLYQFVIEDGACGVGSAAASIANKFISVDNIKFMITGCSGETLIAGPIAQRAGALLFSVFSSHKDVRTLGDYVFRTFVDIERSIKRFSAYIKEHEAGGIALLTEESAFTKNIQNLLLQNLGSQVVFSDEFALDSADFSTLLEKARSTKAKAIFLNAASQGTLVNIINQAAGRKINVRFYSYLYPELTGFIEATGDKSIGVTFLGAPELNQASTELTTTAAEFKKRYGRAQNWDLVFGSTFDAVQALTDGIEAVGAEPVLVKEYLKTYSKEGALGKIEFDENGDVRHINFALKRIDRNGKIVVIDSLLDN